MEQRSKHIETILAICVGMTVFFFVWDQLIFLYISLGVGILGMVFPWAAKLIHLGWTSLGKALGFVNSRILLGVIFFFVLTPLALLRRLGSKDPLQLRKKPSGTYFAERNHAYSPKDLENPW